jgi:hypothetical protein
LRSQKGAPPVGVSSPKTPKFPKFVGETNDPAAPLKKKPKNHIKRLRQEIQKASLMMSP